MSGPAAGLVLAAGAGTRFEPSELKLLAELGGRPLLERPVAALCAVPELTRVVVVLGAGAGQVRDRLTFGRAEPIVCEEWAEGLSASLRCGVAALPEAERIVVTLGDVPGVRPEVVHRLLAAPDGSRATYGGRPGHPVVLGAAQLRRVGELSGDRGARALLDGGVHIECGDLASGRDVDTVADLDALRRAPGPGRPLWRRDFGQPL